MGLKTFQIVYCVVSTYLYGAFDCMFLSCHLRVSDMASVSSKEFLNIQATIECGFTLKRVCDMMRTFSQKRYILRHVSIGNILPWFCFIKCCEFDNIFNTFWTSWRNVKKTWSKSIIWLVQYSTNTVLCNSYPSISFLKVSFKSFRYNWNLSNFSLSSLSNNFA